MKLDGEVNNMMDQLTAAEKELEKKKAEADADMMMAAMVGYGLDCLCAACFIATFWLCIDFAVLRRLLIMLKKLRAMPEKPKMLSGQCWTQSMNY